MGLQKYRADKPGVPCKNGATPWYVEWLGGPSISLVRNCPVKNIDMTTRTVYVRGEADTYFSIPAACTFKGKTITGYLTTTDDGWEFRAHTNQGSK